MTRKAMLRWPAIVGLLAGLVVAAVAAAEIRQRALQRPQLEVLEASFNRFIVPSSHYALTAKDGSSAGPPPVSLVTLQVQNTSPTVVSSAVLLGARAGIYELAREGGAKNSGRFRDEIALAPELKPSETLSVLLWLDPVEGSAEPPQLVLRYEGGQTAVSLAKNRIPWVNFLLAFLLIGALVTGVTYAAFTAVTFVELRKQLHRLQPSATNTSTEKTSAAQ
jgi:predicted ribosomally synthesized peptide with SipW-like signal peptide